MKGPVCAAPKIGVVTGENQDPNDAVALRRTPNLILNHHRDPVLFGVENTVGVLIGHSAVGHRNRFSHRKHGSRVALSECDGVRVLVTGIDTRFLGAPSTLNQPKEIRNWSGILQHLPKGKSRCSSKVQQRKSLWRGCYS